MKLDYFEKKMKPKTYQAWKTILAYVALLLAQYLVELCLLILAIAYWPAADYWLTERNHLQLIFSLSGIISLLLLFEAVNEGKRK